MSVRRLARPTTMYGATSLPVVSYLVDLPVAEPNPAMRLHQVSFSMGGTPGFRTPGRRGFAARARPFRAAHAACAGRQGGRPTVQPGVQRADHQRARAPRSRSTPPGSRSIAMYPVAPLAKGQALAVSCTSYDGRVFFGLTADRDAIPDVEAFAE